MSFMKYTEEHAACCVLCFVVSTSVLSERQWCLNTVILLTFKTVHIIPEAVGSCSHPHFLLSSSFACHWVSFLLCSNFLFWFSCEHSWLEQDLSLIHVFSLLFFLFSYSHHHSGHLSIFLFSPSFLPTDYTRNGSDSFLRKLHPLPVCVTPHLPKQPMEEH